MPFCPFGKRVADSWSNIEPSTFKVRGENYFRCKNVLISIHSSVHEDLSRYFVFTSSIANFLCRDKRKEFAANSAAYYPFGVDVFLSQRKINHVARFVELPISESSRILPPILVVNVQVFPLFRMSALL